MPTDLKRVRSFLGPDLGRRVLGFIVAFGIKAYGAAAALSVALSDAETVVGKGRDAVAAVPNLMDRYRDAKYMIDHRVEISNALDYVNQHAPDPEELETAAQRGTETLRGIETTYDEVVRAGEAITNWNVLEGVPDAVSHLGQAWEARPNFDSIQHLADAAEAAAPFVDQVQVLTPGLYGGLLALVDNFSGDEVVGTLAVMGAALAVAYVLGTAVGFWARRGRPGLISRTLHNVGARLFRGWYVRNPEYAVGPAVYAAARQRIQDDLLVELEGSLDPEALRKLELHFQRSGPEKSPVLAGF